MARPRVELQALLKEYCDTCIFSTTFIHKNKLSLVLVYNRSTDYITGLITIFT